MGRKAALLGIAVVAITAGLWVFLAPAINRREPACTEPMVASPYADIYLIAGGPPELLIIEPCRFKREEALDADISVVPLGVECWKQAPAAGKQTSPWIWLCQAAEGSGRFTGGLQAAVRLASGRTVTTPPFIVQVITGTNPYYFDRMPGYGRPAPPWPSSDVPVIVPAPTPASTVLPEPAPASCPTAEHP
jgi:hypothetical protein